MSQPLDISDIAITIPVFNQLHFTKNCLASLKAAGVRDSQIIVVDNASTDGTAEFLAARPQLRVIHNDQNVGCGGAWSQGSQAAAAPWTAVLNNDILVPPGFFEGLKRFAETKNFDIVSPAMCEGDCDYDWQNYAVEFVEKMNRVRRERVAHGVCFMVHRRVFERIGYFNDFGGYEDDDFFRRALRAKFRLATTGSAFLHHFGSVTQKSMPTQQALDKARARLAHYRHHSGQAGWNWPKRKLTQLRNKFRNKKWRTSEEKQFGHTLRERRVAGRWEYY